MVVIGVGMFLMKQQNDSKQNENHIIGSCLIAFSLLMDGMTGAVQDRMRASCKPSPMHFMFNLNFWSSQMLITLMAITGEGKELMKFAQNHNSIIFHMFLVILVGTAGQVFISSLISNFGSLSLSIVTTIRKFLTVLLSLVLFGNQLTLIQWISTALVFTALLLDSILTKTKKPKEICVENASSKPTDKNLNKNQQSFEEKV